MGSVLKRYSRTGSYRFPKEGNLAGFVRIDFNSPILTPLFDA